MNKLILKGKNNGFVFSASHLIPNTPCDTMHGHNYIVDLELTNTDTKNKNAIIEKTKNILKKYDNLLLLSNYSFNNSSDSTLSKMSAIKTTVNHVWVYRISFLSNKKRKVYDIPISDVIFLDGIEFITTENLAIYLKIEIEQNLRNIDENLSLSLVLYENYNYGVKA